MKTFLFFSMLLLFMVGCQSIGTRDGTKADVAAPRVRKQRMTPAKSFFGKVASMWRVYKIDGNQKMKNTILPTTLIAVTFVILLSACGVDTDKKENSTEAPFRLEPDGLNVLLSYRGKLEGGITHNPIDYPDTPDNKNRKVYGFTSADDKISWTVEAPDLPSVRSSTFFSWNRRLTKTFGNPLWTGKPK